MTAETLSKLLWQKDLPLDETVHRFTVGKDYITDLALVPYDAIGSAAHARMLAHVQLLDVKDARDIVHALKQIALKQTALKQTAFDAGFHISPEQEDCHTAIEAALINKLGQTGKRIHLGRSRNDQVILAMRLLLRDKVLQLGKQVLDVAQAFLQFGRAHADVQMPGYTHLRRAMPSSIGQWMTAFAEALNEELQALPAVYARLDRCPLGAAAGFGVPLSIDRQYTAELLGFSGVQNSPVDVINSRGRHELAVLHWLQSVAMTLEKFFWDAALYSTEEFGFITLPDEFTTGSSIMPQKRNPDVVELARGRCRQIQARVNEVTCLAGGLPSNYHRDSQLQKAPVLDALQSMQEILEISLKLVPRLKLDVNRLNAACSDELYAVNEAYKKVSQGMTFRDA
ncbi:MAG: argininosuccinate lyase, partial [Gammaproteobacteria bacterium]|nr:argininosuccinate lyase [Gammaproteobacteria bacterium]